MVAEKHEQHQVPLLPASPDKDDGTDEEAHPMTPWLSGQSDTAAVFSPQLQDVPSKTG